MRGCFGCLAVGCGVLLAGCALLWFGAPPLIRWSIDRNNPFHDVRAIEPQWQALRHPPGAIKVRGGPTERTWNMGGYVGAVISGVFVSNDPMEAVMTFYGADVPALGWRGWLGSPTAVVWCSGQEDLEIREVTPSSDDVASAPLRAQYRTIYRLVIVSRRANDRC